MRTAGFVIVLILMLSSLTAMANPLVIDIEESYSLVPDNPKGIYLKSEYVKVVVSESITEDLLYVFQNTGEESTKISILLPLFQDWSHYYSIPPYDLENLTTRYLSEYVSQFDLRVDGVEMPYEWTVINLPDIDEYFNYVSIIVNVTFQPGEEKELHVVQIREHYPYAAVIGYSYMTRTARYWNHTIDEAVFEFVFTPQVDHATILGSKTSENILGINGCTVRYEGDNLVIRKEFVDWSPSKDFYIRYELSGSVADSSGSNLVSNLAGCLIALVAIDITVLVVRARSTHSCRTSLSLPR